MARSGRSFRIAVIGAILIGGGGLLAVSTRLGDTETLRTLSQRFPSFFNAADALLKPRPEGHHAPAVLAVDPKDITRVAVDMPDLPAGCEGARTMDADVVVTGDKVRLRFFERAAMTTGEDEAKTVVFERLDLSGVYDVGGDGTVALPLIGRIAARSRSLPCVEALAARGYATAMQAAADVTATFEARPNVLLRGPVRAPGSYAWGEGMTVARLLASAGSAAVGGIDSLGRRMELGARIDEVSQRLLGLELERTRAEASLDRRRSLDLPPALRAQMEEELGLHHVASEITALSAEIDAIEAVETRWQTEAEGLEERITEMQHQYDVTKEQLDYLYGRRDDLLSLRSRGVATTAQLDGATLNIMTSERARLETFSALLALRSSLNAARQSAALAETDRRQRLTLQIRELSNESNLAEAQLRSVRAELARVDLGDGLVEGYTPVTEIERLGADGVTRVVATPDDYVFPGDLVTVSLPTAPSASLIEAVAAQPQKLTLGQ